METRTRGKGTIDRGLRGSVGTLDDMNPTRLSKQSQAVPLHKWKTVFITRWGLFEVTVMYFEFSNAPATFQSMMNDILGDLIHIKLVMVYLDNILIFGTCLKEHRWLVKEVLKRSFIKVTPHSDVIPLCQSLLLGIPSSSLSTIYSPK